MKEIHTSNKTTQKLILTITKTKYNTRKQYFWPKLALKSSFKFCWSKIEKFDIFRLRAHSSTDKHWQDSLYNLCHYRYSIHFNLSLCSCSKASGTHIQAAVLFHKNVTKHGHFSSTNAIVLCQ